MKTNNLVFMPERLAGSSRTLKISFFLVEETDDGTAFQVLSCLPAGRRLFDATVWSVPTYI